MQSRIYKISFEDGTTHYDIVPTSKVYSSEGYISNIVKSYTDKPATTPVGKFKKKVFMENSTLQCIIIFEGEREQAVKFKKELLKDTDKPLTVKRVKKKEKLVKVKKEFISKLTNLKGDELFYIKTDRVYTQKLNKIVDFKQKHPLKSDFVLVINQIEVV